MGMKAVILVVSSLVAATIAFAAIHLLPRMSRRQRVVFDQAADRPLPFGCDMAWIAVRTRDTAGVISELGLDPVIHANWNSGLGTVYDRELGRRRIFVSPPVDGWTFVVGAALPHPVGAGFVDACMPLLKGLSKRFVAVQYFQSYPDLDLFAWARFDGGRLVRAFATTDEGAVWTIGKPTREERALGLKFYELRGVKERKGDAGSEILLVPTEDHVMELAKAWSLDPTRLGPSAATPAVGYVALAPRHWRAERIRKTA